MINKDRIRYLMLAYLTNTYTPEEKKELSGYIAVMEDEELFRTIEKTWQDYKPKVAMPRDKASVILDNILNNNTKSGNKHLFLRSLSIAASIAALIVLSFLIRPDKTNHAELQSVMIEKVEVGADVPTDYIRNITLPDGSNIILQAKSTIRYVNDFSGKTREISLEGQAFFDITPDPEKPFIIHTGLIKTTVLGTAFNIKALSEKDVIISVTRGKVRVENENKVLATLTINQELHYKPECADIKYTPEPVEKVVTEWTRQDMDFDHVPLKYVAEVLSKRYGVSIEIVGLELADSEIVSYFGGTESLEDILKVLCAINSRTCFVLNDKNIMISKQL